MKLFNDFRAGDSNIRTSLDYNIIYCSNKINNDRPPVKEMADE